MTEKARVGVLKEDPPSPNRSNDRYRVTGTMPFDSLQVMSNSDYEQSKEEEQEEEQEEEGGEEFDEEAVLTSTTHREVKIVRTLESMRRLQQQSEPPPRRRLSQQDQDLLKKTSILLTSAAAADSVMNQAEIKRLKEFRSKYIHKRTSLKSSVHGNTVVDGDDGDDGDDDDDDDDDDKDDDDKDDDDKDEDKHTYVSSPFEKSQPSLYPLDKVTTFVLSYHQRAIKKNRLSRWLKKTRFKMREIIMTKQWRWMISFCVFADIFVLALDSEKKQNTILAGLDLFFTCIFALEIIFKMIAFGIYHKPDSYLRKNKFRIINIFIIICSFASYGLDESWRVLRGLKTFRCLTLFSGLRRIMTSVVHAIPFLANVGTLASFFLLAFSIFGYEAFRESYENQCSIQNPYGLDALAAIPKNYCSVNETCAPNNQTCLPQNPPSSHVNFRTGLSSLFLVFLVVTQDGWVLDIMQPVIESTSPLSATFFVAIIASMVFLVVNLFVAVITTSFMNFRSDGQVKKEEAPGYMGKMNKELEDTQVSLIMGATLAIEESISQSLNNNPEGAENEKKHNDHKEKINTVHSKNISTSAGHSDEPFARVESKDRNASAGSVTSALSILDHRASLAQIVRNLTVETTIEMIQHSSTVDDFLLRCNVSNELSNQADTNSLEVLDNPYLNFSNRHSETNVGHLERQGSNHSHVSGRLTTTIFQKSEADEDENVGGFTDDSEFNASRNTSPGFRKFQAFVLSKRFDDFITVCILLNTIFLLIEYHNMGPTMKALLSVAEYLFGIIFIMEMILRIIAMRSLKRYLRNTERFFDTLVVICTTVNMVLNNLDSTGYSGLNSVSSLRTLRVSRLMLKYEGTRKLIESVLKSSRAVLDVVAFMIFFQVVNSVLAMQMFGNGSFTTNGEIPRWNFDTFGNSFLTLLQVITADQWSSIAYDAVDADNPHLFMVPFLILNFIVGQYIVLNLFIAVILENFSISEEEAYQLQLEQILAIPKELQILEKIEEEGVRAFGEMDKLEHVENSKVRMVLGMDQHHTANMGEGSRNGSKGSSSVHNGNRNDKIRSPSMKAAIAAASAANNRYRRETFWGNVDFLWKKWCINLVKSVWFARLVQCSILVSCIALVLDEPHPEVQPEPQSDMFKSILSAVNRVVLFILLIEFVVKVTLQGFGFEYLELVLFKKDELLAYGTKNTYIENLWNRLDLFLLLITIADEVMTGINPQLTVARVFRAGRVLRPLRILNQNKEMKLILKAVALSLPQVVNVLALCSIVYIIFGVTGRSFFAGKLNFCNDSEIKTKDSCTGFYIVYPHGAGAWQENSAKAKDVTGILTPRVWSSQPFSFDNIGSAFISLLDMTSLKWIDKAFAAMDIKDVDQQPETNASAHHAIFFVLFVYIGSLFVIRLFVGVLVEQFQRNNGTQILTESQKCWVDLEKFILLLKPVQRIPRPKNRFRNKVYDIVKDIKFTTFVSGAIMLNVVLLLVNTRSADQSTFQSIEIVFVSIFCMEALLKTIAFGYHFFVSPSGLFELAILMGSLAAYFLASNRYRAIIQAGRIFRMMRVLRFIKLNRKVQTIFQTFRASLRSIANIFFLLFLIFFVFAIVGRQLFGGVKYGMQLNRFTNFRTFQSSFLLLFQLMAGDDWLLLMTDCMITTPDCSENPGGTSDCGSPVGAVMYFITYVILVVFVFVNLFVAVILENFRSCYIEDLCDISLEDFEEYRQIFARYDTTGQGTIPLWQLSSFLAELPKGLRIDASKNRASFLHIRSQAQALMDRDKEVKSACMAESKQYIKQKLSTTVSAVASVAHTGARGAYTLWKDIMDGDNHQSYGARGGFVGQKRPFFNELLRILCIHHLGIRALPYEQQRDRVKQIFIYKEKVARMLVESIVKGYIFRWRQRQKKRIFLALARTNSTTTPEMLNQRVLQRRHEIALAVVQADATPVEEEGCSSDEEKAPKVLNSSPKAAMAHRDLKKVLAEETVDKPRSGTGGDAAISEAIAQVHSPKSSSDDSMHQVVPNIVPNAKEMELQVTQDQATIASESQDNLNELHHDVDLDEKHHKHKYRKHHDGDHKDDHHHHRRHRHKDDEGGDHDGELKDNKTRRRKHLSSSPKGKKRYESGTSDGSSDGHHKHSHKHREHREHCHHKHLAHEDDQTEPSASSRAPSYPPPEKHQKVDVSEKTEFSVVGQATSTSQKTQEAKASNNIYSVMMKSAYYTASKSQSPARADQYGPSEPSSSVLIAADQEMDHATVDIPVSEVVEKKKTSSTPSKRQGKSAHVVPT